MNESYKTILHPTSETHIIAVQHDKTTALRREMYNHNITISHQWPARIFYATHDRAMADRCTQESSVLYGHEIWPFFIECNASPSALISLHKEILNDPTVPHSTRLLTKDESRIALSQREALI
jgi:hypothetical protein